MLKSPLNSQIELTDLCNNKCNHCYNFWNYSDQSKHSLNLEQASINGKQLVEEEVFSVVLTGGEPFLNKEVLYFLVGYLRQNNVDVAINSNLTLIDDEDVSRLKDQGILGILTSLCASNEEQHDAATNKKGSFKKTIQGIKRVQRKNISLAVNMVATNKNFDTVYETGKFIGTELGIKVFNATPINACSMAGKEHLDLSLEEKEYIGTLESLVELEREFDMLTDMLEPVPHCLIFHNYDLEKFLKRTCCAGVSTIAIGADLSVRPCTHSDREYGNLKESSLKSIWEKMEDWRNGAYLPEECEPCSINILCRGGCRTEALAYTGSLQGANPLYKSPLDLRKEAKEKPLLPKGRLQFKEEILSRREGGDIHLLYSPRDRFLEVSYEELRYLSLLKQKYDSFISENLLDRETRTVEERKKLNRLLTDLYSSRFIIESS